MAVMMVSSSLSTMPLIQALTGPIRPYLQELRPLIYPVVQLLLGAARLVPTPRYFPLRLRLMTALNRLAVAAGVFVPVATLLLEMLRWSDLAKAPKGGLGGGKSMESALQLRVSKNTLRTASFQEHVVLQVLFPPLPSP